MRTMAKGGTKSQLCCGNSVGDGPASLCVNDLGFYLDLLPRQLGRQPMHLRAPNLPNTWTVTRATFVELSLDKIPEEILLAFYVSY